MLFKWKKIRHSLGYILDLVMHYLGVSLSFVVIYVSIYFFFFVDYIPFSIEGFAFYIFIFIILIFSVMFLIHNYIYRKRLHIHMQVIMNKLTHKKAQVALKAKECEIPIFKFHINEYVKFGRLLQFKWEQGDIDVTNVPKNLKFVFILFFVLHELMLLCIVILAILVLVIVFLKHKPPLAIIISACKTLKVQESQQIYFRNIRDETYYVFTKQAPTLPLKFDENNAIFIKNDKTNIIVRESSKHHWKIKLKGDLILDCSSIKKI